MVTTRTLLASAIIAEGALEHVIIFVTLIAGTMFLIWLSDLITENGIKTAHPSSSFGHHLGLPNTAWGWITGTAAGSINPIKTILMILIVIVIVALVVLITEGERKIPVQYAKRVVGRKMYGGQSTHIPVKVNMAGVMPVIFSSSLLALLSTVAVLVGGDARNWIEKYLLVNGSVGVYVYSIMNILLIFVFAYFYTAIQFNTVEYAKNLQQYGGFIPGIRPGKPTSEYLQRISTRITFIGAIVLSLLSSLPTVLSRVFALRITFGGTAIIIVVGVILEIWKQIEAMLTMRHYKGFLKDR